MPLVLPRQPPLWPSQASLLLSLKPTPMVLSSLPLPARTMLVVQASSPSRGHRPLTATPLPPPSAFSTASSPPPLPLSPEASSQTKAPQLPPPPPTPSPISSPVTL